jgi:hypothetical protein
LLAKVPAFIFDNPASFDPIDRMFYWDAHGCHKGVVPLLHVRQFTISWLFEGLQNMDILWAEALVSQVLPQVGSLWKSAAFFVSNFFIVHFAFMGLAQVKYLLAIGADQVVFYRMAFFFPL